MEKDTAKKLECQVENNGFTPYFNESLESDLLKSNLFNQKGRIYLTILRFTSGYQRKEAKISISTFQKYTGIAYRWNIIKAINELVKEGFIKKEAAGKGYRKGYNYLIIKNTNFLFTAKTVKPLLQKQYGLNKINKENIYGDFFKNLALREKKIIKRTLTAIRSIRKSNKLSLNVIKREMSYWIKFPTEAVISAMEIYLKKGCAADLKNEKYLRGIIRNEAKRLPMREVKPTAKDILKYGSVTRARETLTLKPELDVTIEEIKEHGSIQKAREAKNNNKPENLALIAKIKELGSVWKAKQSLGIYEQ